MVDEELVINFSREKTTPNTVKFAEVVAPGRERGVVGSIYVLKADLDTIGNPSEIQVTIVPTGA